MSSGKRRPTSLLKPGLDGGPVFLCTGIAYDLHRVSAFRALLGVHLICALGAIGAFWISAFSFKGGPVHRTAGNRFRWLIYAAAITGGTLALAGIAVPSWGHPQQAGQSPDEWTESLRLHRQTMWVVMYMLLLIVAPTHHGVAVVAAGPVPARVRSRLHATLNLLCLVGTVALLAACVIWQRWIFLTLAPIGFTIGLRNMSYAARSSAMSRDWEQEHLTSMLTAGAMMHTALLVFGASRTLDLVLTTPTELLLWLLPALVALPAIFWLRSKR